MLISSSYVAAGWPAKTFGAGLCLTSLGWVGVWRPGSVLPYHTLITVHANYFTICWMLLFWYVVKGLNKREENGRKRKKGEERGRNWLTD